jgi:serine/threonine protein kinase/Tfp pilus assembly protein PilF
VRVEGYCHHFTNLPDDVLVALLYEEFCLREEAGETPDPAEYQARFPAVAKLLSEVLDIHALVGSSRGHLANGSTLGTLSLSPGATVAFPEAGQLIGGFRLVEELGRGTFARVFLAQERRLGDRPVALKLTSSGTHEPQTLARLQHTHIVPVYSYHTEPATGLHLLCMPYFGRVTLEALLSDPHYRSARTGADLLAVLDRVRPASDLPSPRSEGRSVLTECSFSRAVAWWGARLAEALDHAHGRGILHRDVKPSNILLTADATPMLLDFNLASPQSAGGPAERCASLGGTIAYMAPEHLTALIEGKDEGLDGRADIYALGVVLFQALAFRPFSTAVEGRSGIAAVRALIEERRAGPPKLKAPGRAVPAALTAVVHRCLAPDPAHRYASAAELAVDLQAVVDDGPLKYAREPEPSRSLRWVSRHRRQITLAVPLALGLVACTALLFRSQAERLRVEAQANRMLDKGLEHFEVDQYALAEEEFFRAWELTSDRPSLRALAEEARTRRDEAIAARRACDTADAFFAQAEPLRFRLVEGKDLKAASHALEEALGPLHVFGPGPWPDPKEWTGLDGARRARLIEEVNDLLFLWVVASDQPDDPESIRRARAVCDRALRFADPAGPWRALRARYEPPAPGLPPVSDGATDPRRETSAQACFQWAVLAARLDEQPARALAWLERAARLRPNHFWYQFALAFHYALFDDVDRALAHYDTALALWPDSAWTLFNRAQLYWSRKGAYDRARADLERAEAASARGGLDPATLRLEFGQIAQRLGDFPGALAEYEALVTTRPEGEPARQARLNRAKILAELGDSDGARADYEAILSRNPRDLVARAGRALLALRVGDAAQAEAELTRLLEEAPQSTWRDEWLDLNQAWFEA